MTHMAKPDWGSFWDAKANSGTDFQATGRGFMDVVGFLHTVHEIARLLTPRRDDVLVDIGCGTGLIALALAPWVHHVHAIDLSANMVVRARQNLANVNNVDVAMGSITRVGLPALCCERVLAYSVLQYLHDKTELADAFRETFRILRPGGRALLAANPDPSRRAVLEQLIRARTDQEAANRELALQEALPWIPAERMCELARDIGFRPYVEPISERIWQHFYMFDLVLEKP